MTIIAGPCAAESREQVMTVAEKLSAGGVKIFRASAWKPRTRAGGFEGRAESALQWLSEVRERFGMRVTTEINSPKNVELLSKYSIDLCWIGARTSCSPFTVSELALALAGRGIDVMVKNPICPDLGLWIGAVERLQNAGIENITAIHRGFMQWGAVSPYRNEPIWDIPRQFLRQMPSIPLICDPSHIAGRADLVEQVAHQALRNGMQGLMIEVHPNPSEALSDAQQQLTPTEALKLISDVQNYQK